MSKVYLPKLPYKRPNVWDVVIEDMRARDAKGEFQYGSKLQTLNGRDALQDAYEEALDLAVYLKQVILERNALRESKNN